METMADPSRRGSILRSYLTGAVGDAALVSAAAATGFAR